MDGLPFPNPNKEDDPDSSSGDEEDGYIEVKNFKTGENLQENEYDILLISRRSRYRAGMKVFLTIDLQIFIYLFVKMFDGCIICK